MNISKLFRLLLIAGIILYGIMMPTNPVFVADVVRAEEPQPQEQPIQPSEANPRYEPEQIAEPERADAPPPVEEQQTNEPDEIEQAAPPLNQ